MGVSMPLIICVDGKEAEGQYHTPSRTVTLNLLCDPAREKRLCPGSSHQASELSHERSICASTSADVMTLSASGRSSGGLSELVKTSPPAESTDSR